MLNLPELKKAQSEGDYVLAGLTTNEMTILENYGVMVVKGLKDAGQQAKQPTINIILNAFRQGISLGLGIEVYQGEVQERRKL